MAADIPATAEVLRKGGIAGSPERHRFTGASARMVRPDLCTRMVGAQQQGKRYALG
jgi:hypothetical protein